MPKPLSLAQVLDQYQVLQDRLFRQLLEQEQAKQNKLLSKQQQERLRKDFCSRLPTQHLTPTQFFIYFAPLPNHRQSLASVRSKLLSLYPEQPCLIDRVKVYALRHKLLYYNASKNPYLCHVILLPPPLPQTFHLVQDEPD